MPVTSAAQARELLEGVGGGTSPAAGEELHEFVREHRFERCMELGFAHGGSAVYIASALEANGAGHLDSVDLEIAKERQPPATETLKRAGLEHRVTLNYEATSYTWFLHGKLREQLRDGERIEPLYDFVFIDGAHTWDVDALAFALVDRLLKPGGWILLDDLDWKLGESDPSAPAAQRELSHVREIWELLALTHPQYDEFRTDQQWGWARKSPDATPATRTVVKQDLAGSVRQLGRIAKSKLGR
ncbi:MAG TPA: class I SAM-dependent methyltransferase [Baekduia sp.]|nr:class I SAM-dependent methyltransferase [Baekduia sp.]